MVKRGRRAGGTNRGSLTERLQQLSIGERIILDVPRGDRGQAMRSVHSYWRRASALSGRYFTVRYMLLVPPAVGAEVDKVMVIERVAQ